MTTGACPTKGEIRRRLPSLASLTAGLLIAATAGCQSGYRNHANAIASELDAGRYAEASARSSGKVEHLDEDDIDAVVLLLEAGRTAQIAGEFEASTRWFGEVHDRVRPYLDTEAEASVSEGVATTAVNQTVSLYKGTPSDRMLASALNATNLLALGKIDDARVELNRAADWQQDAVNRFRKQIEEELDKTREEAKENDDPEVSKELVDQQLGNENFSNLENLTAYADFANPFIDHLRGVFYLTFAADQSDLDTARFAFRQVAAMEPAARPMLDADLEAVESATRRRSAPTTWVYFLTGLGPRLEQLYIPVPIPVGNVNFVSAAFPVMKFDPDFAPSLTVTGGTDGDGVATVPLADMDRIVGAEFRERLPLIITQEILSAALKAAATYGLQQGLGDWGQIGGIIYQAASTAADTRMWRSVPKQFMLARVPTPPDGRLSIATDRPLGEIEVAPGVSNVVMVTLPAAGTPSPSVASIPLTRRTEARAASDPAEATP